MIRVKWLHEQKLTTGSENLITQWLSKKEGIIWVDIQNEPTKKEAALLTQFGCHPLAIQDAQRERHPPKVEDFSDNTFILYRGFESFDLDLKIKHVQLSFFVGEDFFISRRNGSSFGVKALWENETELIRYLRTPAILLTRIVNTSLSGYINHMIELETSVSEMEDQMLYNPTDNLMHKLVLYRSSLRKLNRIFRYHEKVFGEALRESTVVFDMKDEELFHSMQDVYDKCERLLSLSTLFYEQCGDLVEGYLSLSSHQLNKTMQVLTVVTAIFIPLGFLAGIYGMNFENMPELHSPNGYYWLLGVMTMIASILIFLFKRKRWL